MCSCGLIPHTETRVFNMFRSYAQISIQSSDSLRYVCLLHIITYIALIRKQIYTACCPLSPTPNHHGTENASCKIQVLNTMCMNEDNPQYSTFVHMEALCPTEKLATRKNQVLKDEHKKLQAIQNTDCRRNRFPSARVVVCSMRHGSGKSGRKFLLIAWASCNLTESLWSGPTSWATYVYLHSRIRTSSSHASLFSTLQKDPHSLAQSLSRSLGRRKLGTHHRAPEALPALSLHISSSTWAPRIQSPAQQ